MLAEHAGRWGRRAPSRTEATDGVLRFGVLGVVAGLGAAVDLEDVGLAALADAAELPLVEGDEAVVLDADLPRGVARDAVVAAVVVDEPTVFAGWPLAGAAAVVDVLGAEAVAVVHVEFAPILAQGVLPVDLRPTGFE